MAKERMGPLAPTIYVLWDTTEKNMAAKLCTFFIAVKHCGRFIISKASLRLQLFCMMKYMHQYTQKR